MSKNNKYIIGINNPNYKHGKNCKEYNNHCIDCGKIIDYRSKRCYKCRGKTIKENKHHNWKGDFPKCIDCGKKLSIRKTKKYIPKRCMKCWHIFAVGKDNPMYHKKGVTKYQIVKHHKNLNKKDNRKKNILKLTQSKHIKLHHFAYNYLVKINKIEQYTQWFKKNYM